MKILLITRIICEVADELEAQDLADGFEKTFEDASQLELAWQNKDSSCVNLLGVEWRPIKQLTAEGAEGGTDGVPRE